MTNERVEGKAHEFTLERRVEFADTDMAGIMHFANFFRFMEATEHAFFRSLGLTLHSSAGGHMRGWARVHAACEYLEPLHYQDLVRVHLGVGKVGRSSISYAFEFRLAERPEPVARGSLKVTHIGRDAGQDRMQARPIPAEVAERIEAAPLLENHGDTQ